MTFGEAYSFLCEQVKDIYDDREGATISRYLIEDLFVNTFWSEEILSHSQEALLHQTVKRLLTHEPWQYIGGYADFYGLKFKVDKSVLIPRPETEELVYLAMEIIKNETVNSILDIGTGSGIIPITLSKKTKLSTAYGLDLSKEALEIARENNSIHQSNVTWIQQDFLSSESWTTLPKVDLVISNPPYITKEEAAVMHPNVLNHEPHLALFVDHDPMLFYNAVANMVVGHQSVGCKVIVEINENFGPLVCQNFRDAGLVHVGLIKDMQNKNRIVVAEKAI